MPAYTKPTIVFEMDTSMQFCRCANRVDAGEHRCLKCGKELPEHQKLAKVKAPRPRRQVEAVTGQLAERGYDLARGKTYRRPQKRCANGHVQSAANTYRPHRGARRCLLCKHERERDLALWRADNQPVYGLPPA